MPRTNVIFIPVGVPAGAAFSIDLNGTDEFFKSADVMWAIVNAWSVSYWLKPNVGALGRIISLREAGGTENIILIDMENTGIFNIQIYSSAGVLIKSYDFDDLWDDTPIVSEWQHHITTWNGTNLLFYVDGVLAEPTRLDTDSSGTMTDTSRLLRYGNNIGENDHFEGLLGHLSFWDVVLDQDDIAQVFADEFVIDLSSNSGTYDKSTSLQHYYRPGFAGPGTDIGDTDEAGSNDFSASSNLTSADIVTDAPADFTKQSVLLNGTSQYFENGTDNTLGFGDTWSISFWAKAATVTGGQRRLISIAPTPDNESFIFLNYEPGVTNNTTNLQLLNSAGTIIFKNLDWNNIWGTDASPDLNWKHLLLTFNGAVGGDPIKLYIDGVDTAPDTSTTDSTGAMADDAREIRYGVGEDTDDFWDGNLGHFAIWDVVLDQNDVDSVFAGKHVINLRVNSGTYDKQANLKHYYRPGFNVGTYDYVGKINLVNSVLGTIVTDAPA